MTRLIPGKTKVQIELFRGISLGDILVAGVALTMLIFLLMSNLPYKVYICLAVAMIAGSLLVRIGDQANYLYLLHIFSHFGYDRHFARSQTDAELTQRMEDSGEETPDENANSSGGLSAAPRETKTESAAEKKKRRKAEKAERKKRLKAEKAAEKKRQKERKREDRILKNKKVPRAEKDAILAKREAEAREEEVSKSVDAVFDSVAKQDRKISKEERKTNERARARARKEEDKRLKSKTVPEEEKEAIRARRAKESEESMRRLAESKDASTVRKNMDNILGFTAIRDGLIEYGKREYYGAVIEIDPIEFRFFSEHRRRNSIESGLGRILRSVNNNYSANIIKIERPIRYESYLIKEYDKLEQLRGSYESGMLTEDELKARVEVEYDRINELWNLCGDDKVVTGFYYIALFDSDKRQLEVEVGNALVSLAQGEMIVRRLKDKELAVFLKYTNALDFDESMIDKISPEDYAQWAKPDVVDIKARRVEINHIITHNLRVVSYPTAVDDAWIAGVMSMPGTKVVLKARPMDREKAIRGIDRSLVELRGQWSSTGVDSRRMELEEHVNTLQGLLGTLQSDNESLLECNIYITAYDIVATRNNFKIKQPGESILPTISDMKRTVRRTWQESGFRLGNMEFEQVEAFLGSQVSGLDPLSTQGRGIPSNTIAACYPWIYAHISDEGGVKLGANDGIPVFIDFFRRDNERVNSNMVIVGKSGSGKSYATKSILSNLAADDSKIFILDPENEYQELAGNLHGKIINVGNAQYGRLNPFHIITALDDDEAGEGGGPSGSYATHLQFLEEFFRQILPDCDKDSMEYLNTMTDRLYSDFNITPETDLSKLHPEDYPVFDDLYDAILKEFQSTDNQYIRTMLRTLLNYIAKFSTGGRNANIWNGPSTVTTDTNFTVFNFQSMLANRNTTIANAQMLLVLKYIDNEIIKNRDYNAKYNLKRKIVVVIDEAHVFIDAKFPIALDFMFQLAKRIRKYNGMQIVITQNIKDFVGSEEIARKSTAIINACQYSFIFALSPNDIQDLVKLYANAGGINENEQEQIVQAPRGQAFTIMSASSRSTFRVETGPSMIHMFEDKNFVSRYFVGTEGAQAWEDFIGNSREVHNRFAPENETAADSYTREERAAPRASILFEEVSGDEYDSEENSADDAANVSSGVFLEETTEDDDLSWNEITEETAFEQPRSVTREERAANGFSGEAGQTAFSPVEQLADALTESFRRAGIAAPSGGQDSGATLADVRRAIDEQLSAEREELRREREALRAIMDRFNQMTSAGVTGVQTGVSVTEAEDKAPDDDSDLTDDSIFAELEIPDDEEEIESESDVYLSGDTEIPDDDEDDGNYQFSDEEDDDYWKTYGEDEPDEDEYGDEEDQEDQEDQENQENGNEFDEEEDEEEDEEDEEDEDEDDDWNDSEYEDMDDDSDDSAFDLSAFLRLSTEDETENTVNIVERMRREGVLTSPVTLQELIEYIERKK